MRLALLIPLYAIVAVLIVYTVRHYLFTLNRLFGRHRQPYVDIGTAAWPRVAVFVPCHNEERVIAQMRTARGVEDVLQVERREQEHPEQDSRSDEHQ